MSRGYKLEWVDTAAKRFESVTQEECLNPAKRPKEKNNSPLCITRYSAMGSEFRKILHKHWHIIDTDPKLKEVFKEPPKLVLYVPPI